MGSGSDTRRTGFQDPVTQEGPPEVDADGVTKVRTLSLKYFRAKLVENFDILWQREQIQWPTRTGLGPRPQIDAQFYNADSTII
jgi:hypothetical protein